MEFTIKDLIEKLNLTKMALSKGLSEINFELKRIDGSFKPVKHYKYDDLPARYKEKLEKLGIVSKNKVSKDEHISSTNNFTHKYLLAHPIKQKQAIAKVKLIEFYLKRTLNLNQKQWLDQTLKNDISFDVLGSVSPKQLNDWLTRYKETKARGLNIVEAFVDGRGASSGTKALDKNQQDMAIRYFLRTSRPKISSIHRNMCHTFGDTMSSYDAFIKSGKEKIQFYMNSQKALIVQKISS
jgi:putative transposase